MDTEEDLSVEVLKNLMKEIEYREDCAKNAEVNLVEARERARLVDIALKDEKMKLFRSVCLVINERDELRDQLAAQRAKDSEHERNSIDQS